MIENKINNLKNRFVNVRMSKDDKRDVFKRISLVVDKIESISLESHKAPTLSPFSNSDFKGSGRGILSGAFASNIFVYVRQRKFVPSLVIVLLLCVTGSISAEAENALPGDSLYSVKVNVNEQVKGIVAVTPEAKARLAVETTERRLQEAVILSTQGKLTDQNKQILQDQLTKSATDVNTNVASLVASNDIAIAQDVSTNFEASLKTHQLILENIVNKDSIDSSTSTVVAVVSTSTSPSTSSTTTSPNTLPAVVSSSTPVQVNSSAVSATATTAIDHPAKSLIENIQREINYNTHVREDLSQKEIAQDSNPDKIATKIKEAKAKYEDLNYQRKTLKDLGYPSVKLFDSYLNTASSTISGAEKALTINDLSKAISLLQQAIKAMSDSDSLISIELNGKPEIKKALELIDINKLLNVDSATTSFDGSGTNATSTSAQSGTSGSVLGTTTPSTI